MKFTSIITLAFAAAVTAWLHDDDNDGLYVREAEFEDDYSGWISARSEESHLDKLIARHEDELEFLYQKREGGRKCERCGRREAMKGGPLCGACYSALKTVHDPQPIAPKPASGRRPRK